MILSGYLILTEMVRWISRSSSWLLILHSAKMKDKSLSGHSGIKSIISKKIWEGQITKLNLNTYIYE